MLNHYCYHLKLGPVKREQFARLVNGLAYNHQFELCPVIHNGYKVLPKYYRPQHIEKNFIDNNPAE